MLIIVVVVIIPSKPGYKLHFPLSGYTIFSLKKNNTENKVTTAVDSQYIVDLLPIYDSRVPTGRPAMTCNISLTLKMWGSNYLPPSG